MKLYASPGGGASIIMTETSQCSQRPMKGALNGLLLAHNRDNGRMPSRPISWTTIHKKKRVRDLEEGIVEVSHLRLPWENITLSTFPNAESATKTDKTRSASDPNIFRKNVAATMRPELMISSLETAAK